MTFHLTWFILFSVRFGLLNGHSCICHFSFIRFGYKGWIWDVIALVPVLCIRFTFNTIEIYSDEHRAGL